MHEGKPLASGIVDLIAGTLDEELGRNRKADKVDTRDVARRITIDLLDHLESRGVLFGRRHGPPGPPPPPPPGDGGDGDDGGGRPPRRR